MDVCRFCHKDHVGPWCPEKDDASYDVTRVRAWKEKNRERYNLYMREYMKKRRSK